MSACQCDVDTALGWLIDETIEGYCVNPDSDPVGYGVTAGMMIGLAMARHTPEYGMHLLTHFEATAAEAGERTIESVRRSHQLMARWYAQSFPAGELRDGDAT